MSIAPDPDRSAIVLGGGGVAGIAWELGLLQGLLDEDIPLDDADLVIGTSAGSTVGTLLRMGLVSVGYDQQFDAPTDSYVQPPTRDMEALQQMLGQALAGSASEQDARARLGALAAEVTDGQTDDERVATFRETFPDDRWPDAPLGITAVDVDGTFRVFTKDDGVPLTRAIAASCSVPFVWSPVHIDGRSYVDGGARSVTNADAAEGCGRVLVIACRQEDPSPLGPSLDQAVARMREQGTLVEVVVADEAAQAAYGDDSLSMSAREPSAHAGRVQAGTVAERVRAFWVD
jgi:NTE family protein